MALWRKLNSYEAKAEILQSNEATRLNNKDIIIEDSSIEEGNACNYNTDGLEPRVQVDVGDLVIPLDGVRSVCPSGGCFAR